MSREFAEKPQAVPRLFVSQPLESTRKLKKFPVFSLLIREFGRRDGFDRDCLIRTRVLDRPKPGSSADGEAGRVDPKTRQVNAQFEGVFYSIYMVGFGPDYHPLICVALLIHDQLKAL